MTKNQASNLFHEQFIELKEGEKNNVSRIINKLFQVNFLTRRKPGDTNDYRFILAFKDLFDAFFQLSDFSLNIKREDEVVFIKNEQLYNHMRLRKTESLLILILRVLYQRKKDLITLDEDAEVFLYEIHEELTRIGYLDHKRITKDRLKPALTFLRNYNIIDYIDRGLHDDARIKIYPTILYITDINGIKEVIDRIDQYMEGGGSEAYEETDED